MKTSIAGALTGAGMSALGAIYGGIQSAKNRRKVREQIANDQAENNRWYNRHINEDGTNIAGAQQMLTRMQDAVRNRNQQARARQAVIGGTDAAVADVNEQNAKALENATGNIVANNEAQKERYERMWLNRRAQLEHEQAQYDRETANNIANATTGALQTAGSITSSLVDTPDKVVTESTDATATTTAPADTSSYFDKLNKRLTNRLRYNTGLINR